MNNRVRNTAINNSNRFARNNIPKSALPRWDAIIVSGKERMMKMIKGLR